MLNEYIVKKFVEVFEKKDKTNDTDPTNDMIIPIVPTWGNNDMLPHNILTPGPNKWTAKYLDLWRKFIPEEQRHGFLRGGWFSVEVIPSKLTIFSLNTLYFFSSNSAVDGCAKSSEPGYSQMEWLRIQLQFVRERGMKAIIMGHVPPARTESKSNWDETCWAKYTLWMRQYRDVVVGSLFGHMNIDHFVLQDSRDVKKRFLHEKVESSVHVALDDDITVRSSSNYLTDLRSTWSRLPLPPKLKEKVEQKGNTYDSNSDLFTMDSATSKLKKKRSRETDEQEFYNKIGGQWGERYNLALVSPSIVPNYFPTLRVFDFNITGLIIANRGDKSEQTTRRLASSHNLADDTKIEVDEPVVETEVKTVDTSRGKKPKKPKKPNLTVPEPPSQTSLPGPAYSPQTLTWLGYTQYFANLTEINNDFTRKTLAASNRGTLREDSWNEGKYHDRRPHNEDPKHSRRLSFEVEYDTRHDEVYKMKDLTVRSFIDLAARIGQYRPNKEDRIGMDHTVQELASDGVGDIFHQDHTNKGSDDDEVYTSIRKEKQKKHKKHRKHKRRAINRVWFTFVYRAFIGTRDNQELHDDFGQPLREISYVDMAEEL